jgi:putative oxidoreductase
MSAGLLIIRLVVGLGLAAHGAQKLFGWFGGGGLDATATGMEHMGFRPGRANAVAAGAGELAGGLLLATGLLMPLAAAIVIGVMVNAGLVHWPNGYFLTKGGYEYTLTIGAVAAGLALTSAGSWSLDHLLGLDFTAAAWGVTAIAVGLVAGAARAGTRRHEPVPVA